jgi:hypothetical protein
MSYSSHMNVVECAARMKAIDVGKAQRVLRKANSKPESCFLDEMTEAAADAIDADEPDRLIDVPKDRCWFSGNVDACDLARIAPMIAGKLSGYFVGEDGDHHSGFSIEDGRFRECTITVTVTPTP